jgi:ferric-dicitrate binding protein FerR (iron transport regulator)
MNDIKNDKSVEQAFPFRFAKVESDADVMFHRIQNKIECEQTQFSIGVSYKWKYAAIAASVLLVLLSTLYATTFLGSKLIPNIEVMAVAGSKTRVVLPDETVVWLNGSSSIKYPQEFSSNERLVSVSGEAFFEVSKDKTKPFIVQFNQMDIKVLGTEFNVLAAPHSSVIETTLLNGSVAICNTSNQKEQILKPNQQALFNIESQRVEILDVEAASYASWVNGNFDFKGIKLTEIVRQLGRAYCVKIHIQNESLKTIRLQGRFTNTQTLDEILAILQISANYNYKRVKGEIFIN